MPPALSPLHPPLGAKGVTVVPSTPLGSFQASAVSWASWTTLMAFVGLCALTLLLAGPARRSEPSALEPVTVRLVRAAVVAGVLTFPAVLTDSARTGSGYDYAAAWRSLYDGSTAGLLAGLQTTLAVIGALLLLPLTRRRAVESRLRQLIPVALVAGAVALGAAKFPSKAPADWGRTVFETFMWMLHLFGGAVWTGGLLGLLLLALPGGLPARAGAGFWSPAIRRFSAAAMICVASIGLSGLFLYWEHVDGPGQLLSTMYGRTLGVKILIFGAMLLLGVLNQFWLHPRVEARRAAGDERPRLVILTRRFPAVIAAEALLGLSILFVAPFLHGSARNQAFQADAVRHAVAVGHPLTKVPKLAAKQVEPSTWIWGTLETATVAGVMVAGYRYSARLARKRIEAQAQAQASVSAAAAAATSASTPALM